ncbi:DnaJ domain-containing protein [uncultured Pseudomonas sp.]|uniref:DnaJ domain-containing protein n=1 Tax=uncultured Pseudomonas sp. TaxID=114707 RepID=UPI0026010180|nr:DnaJ domain-containing protein [uncultured Pseudomonas sp.]
MKLWFWPLTLLGFLAGWAVASIPGALLVALLAHAGERQLGLTSVAGWQARWRGRPGRFEHRAQFQMLGRLAKRGGRVLTAHIRQAEGEIERLALSAEDRRRAIAAFEEGKGGTLPSTTELQQLSERAELILRACWRMVWISGSVRPGDRDEILGWGQTMGLAEAQVLALQPPVPAAPRQPTLDEKYRQALQLLGVTEDADAATVKQAYRRLLSRHHPDKKAGAGAAQSAVYAAAQRTAELHAAYQLIKTRRGFR